ncbi:MAG: DUF4347 domain-containing protein, partial [Pseudomonadota bacterium]
HSAAKVGRHPLHSDRQARCEHPHRLIKACLPDSRLQAHNTMVVILGEMWTMVDPTGRTQARQQRRAIEEKHREGIEITAIDDQDLTGWVESATRIGELYITSVESLVDKVLKKVNAGEFKVRRLNIIDHGNKHAIEIGNDIITLETLPKFSTQLGRLKGIFHSKGFVHCQHCEVGSNLALLKALSNIFGVPVYAGTGKHNAVYRFNTGQYNRCVPSGRCDLDVGRP